MRIPVQKERFNVLEINLLFLLFLSVFFIGTALAAHNPKGTLGVSLGEITPEIKKAAGLHGVNGAVIHQVLPGSAAARAGLQPGDLIIGVDGSGVDGPAEVVKRIGRHSSGESIAFVILRPDRKGRVRQFQVNPVLQSAAKEFTPGQQGTQPTRLSSSPGPKPLVKSPANPPGSKPTQKPPSTGSPLGTSFAGSMQPVRTHICQACPCSALAPANWVIFGGRREGDSLDIKSADGNMYAGYLILGIPGFMATASPGIYGSPETFLRYTISSGGSLQVSYGRPSRDNYGYTWLPIEARGPNIPHSGIKGFAHYRVWPMPGDPQGYILLYRSAVTTKPLWGALWRASNRRCAFHPMHEAVTAIQRQ